MTEKEALLSSKGLLGFLTSGVKQGVIKLSDKKRGILNKAT